MKKIFVGIFSILSITNYANADFCRCNLADVYTSPTYGLTKARVNLELMDDSTGLRVAKIEFFHTYSKNWNENRAVNRAQKRCEKMMKNHTACFYN